MTSWFTTRRDAVQIVVAWLGCLLVVCGAWLASVLGFFDSARQAKTIRLAANRIRIHELDARRAEKDFVLRSLTDETFFRRGRSEYLDRHEAKVSVLLKEIDHLVGHVPPEQSARALRLVEMVDRYERGFRELVAAYRKRGFQEWGLEGALKKALAGLERTIEPADSVAVEQALLDLSRAEQRFLLHRSPDNAERVADALSALRDEVSKSERLELVSVRLGAVEEYYETFTELVDLEREIGLTEELGLQGELREAIHAVEPAVEEILKDAVHADEEANRTLVVGLFVACFIMAVLLSLAIFFAQSARLQSKRLLQTNQQMEEEHRKLLQSERLAAIGQMVAGLAHESRNALQRTHACLDMLSQELKDRPSALALVSRIEDSQDHIHLLYEQVRDYAAPVRLKRAPTRLASIVQSAWEHLELVHRGRNVQFAQCADGVDLHCEVDAFSIEQVFRNIFENALAACENQDPTEVRVLYRETRVASGSMLQVVVHDNGPGLDAEQRARIFDPFYTTKTRGTGLGMAIARRVVEAHGGVIEVGSTASGGAEIVVTLPRSA